MLLVIAIQKETKISSPLAVFMSGMAVTTAAELAGSYVTEMLTGKLLWSYDGFFLNFEGRIALKPSILFGLLVLFPVKAIHPKIAEMQGKYKNSAIHNILFGITAVIFMADLLARIFAGSNI